MLVKPGRSERIAPSDANFSDETDKIPPEQEHDRTSGRPAGLDGPAERALRFRAGASTRCRSHER